MGRLSLEVITAERTAFSGSADLVTLPGKEGQFTVLPFHVPLIAALDLGEIRVMDEGKETLFTISGGFVEVAHDTLTILVDTAERDDEIDLERSREAEKRAQSRLASTGSEIDLERALKSLARARARSKTAQHRRSRRNTLGSTSDSFADR